MATIGFIGLGNMGRPMAANLAKAGHTVTGYDTARVDVCGMVMAQSAAEAAADKDAVITMLPNGDIVRSVYREIVPAGSTSACYIDCSTVDVESARAAHKMAEEAGLLSLDAPVSGGVAGAAAATLTFMVGGSAEAFTAASPFFQNMGKKAVHCGAAGAGQAAKICNNMLLGISMIGVCEAFTLADKLGLDRQKLFDVASASSGSCWSLNTYCPVPRVGPKTPADDDYKPGFAAELMLKDLLLSQQAAKISGAATPLGTLATSLYDDFVGASGKGRDFSAILLYLTALERRD